MYYKFLPPANEVWGKFVFTRVCDSVHRGEYLGRYPPGQVPPLGRYPHRAGTSPQHVHPPAGTPPLADACWDTVDKRAVRILLECILVLIWNSFKMLDWICTVNSGFSSESWTSTNLWQDSHFLKFSPLGVISDLLPVITLLKTTVSEPIQTCKQT